MRRRRALPLAAALGAATVAGFAPFGWFLLPLFTLASLFRLWQQTDSPRTAGLLGLAWGLGCFLTGVSWVYVSLHDVGGMALPLALVATLAFCTVLALFPALAGYAYGRLRGHYQSPTLLLAALWCASELLRGWVFTGFPWLALGYAQTPPSPLAGFAPILGVYGVGLLVAWLAALIATASRPHWPKNALAIAGVLLGGALLGHIDWTRPTGAPLSVALLQGNIPQSLKWDPERLSLSLDRYAELAARHPAQLTVLPETAIPLFFQEIPSAYLARLQRHGDVLLGAALRDATGEGYTNAALALSATAAPQAYAKSHLVPFGEYVPPGFAWFFELVRIPLSDFHPGPGPQPPLSLAGQQIAPNICYEDLFGEELRQALPEATLLVNLSNTAWFGDSLAQPQHLQIARLRALETGRPMLRATNTGMTAAIAPDGHVMAVLPPFTAGALSVTVQGYTGTTPYGRWGNHAAFLLTLILLAHAIGGALVVKGKTRDNEKDS